MFPSRQQFELNSETFPRNRKISQKQEKTAIKPRKLIFRSHLIKCLWKWKGIYRTFMRLWIFEPKIRIISDYFYGPSSFVKHIKCIVCKSKENLLGRQTQQVFALKFTLLWINEFMKKKRQGWWNAIKVSILNGFFSVAFSCRSFKWK